MFYTPSSKQMHMDASTEKDLKLYGIPAAAAALFVGYMMYGFEETADKPELFQDSKDKKKLNNMKVAAAAAAIFGVGYYAMSQMDK
jgi:hypothetical protein